MATTALVRKPVQFPEVTEATLNAQIADEARKYLGYEFGERRNKEVTERLTQREQLVKVQVCLKSCGIVPIDEQSVLRYQARVRKNAMQRERAAFTGGRWSWRTIEVSNYRAEIPQFALDRATRVAKTLNRRMPSLKKTFAVSELHRTQAKRKYDPDPFMVLQVLGHNFYLDVWNEPSFEGRRAV